MKNKLRKMESAIVSGDRFTQIEPSKIKFTVTEEHLKMLKVIQVRRFYNRENNLSLDKISNNISIHYEIPRKEDSNEPLNEPSYGPSFKELNPGYPNNMTRVERVSIYLGWVNDREDFENLSIKKYKKFERQFETLMYDDMYKVHQIFIDNMSIHEGEYELEGSKWCPGLILSRKLKLNNING